ncbi:MAG: CHAD domain-containing protein [Deltaproteobacteria bacterium]|nr:CHAD domain-containing protein [Deltaproteobacteria bacterium]
MKVASLWSPGNHDGSVARGVELIAVKMERVATVMNRKRRARHLSRWRRQLLGSLSLAERTGDAEAVHDLRVAARRLRAYARIAHDERLDRDLRKAIHATNALRDFDVAIELGSSGGELRKPRADEARRVRHALGRKEMKRLERELANVPPVSRGDAKRRIAELRKKATRLRRGAHSIDDTHALRRTLRELQYCLDWIGEDSAAVEARQRDLGAIVDKAVLRRVRRSLRASGIR